MTKAAFTSDGSGELLRLELPAAMSQTSIVAPDRFYYLEPDLNYADLKDGERVLDRVEEVLYTYRDGTLVEPIRF